MHVMAANPMTLTSSIDESTRCDGTPSVPNFMPPFIAFSTRKPSSSALLTVPNLID